jgi:transaldolase
MAGYWLEDPSRAVFDEVLGQSRVEGITLSTDARWYPDDVQYACDALAATGGRVSQMVVAKKDSTASILKKAESIVAQADRPNLMVAIPAHDAGIEAMGTLVSWGISVQAISLFSSALALRIAETIVSQATQGARGILSVSVSPFDHKMNAALKAKGLAQNRIGFFAAMKIYNQIEAMGEVPLDVMFTEIEETTPEVEATYYLENLNLPGALFSLSSGMYQRVANQPMEESFHFQTRHLDAFFSYLTPAGISLLATEEELFDQALA